MIFWRKDKAEKAAPQTEQQTPDRSVEKPAELAAAPVIEVAAEVKESGWLSRLSQGLSKSSGRLTQGLVDLVTKRKLDQEMVDQLEDALITADLGPKTASRIVGEFAEGRFGKDLDDSEIRTALADVMAGILRGVDKPMNFDRPANGGPLTVLVCGVNGVGKTTTIGKLAYNLVRRDGKSVMLAAGDTFRAAAVEQLKIWADRAGADFVARDTGADSAAVAYESYAQAKERSADVLFIDTAGRLQNKKNLMDELQKIIRVLRKHDENLPHAVLLVLDATTGQNAHSQVETFRDMVDVTGLVVTKLDGSAKGGVVVSLADRFGLPIIAVGVGEQADDLQPFRPDDYARSLVGLSA